jgi:glycosyltransferase involved in cell wall biosynthesis
MTTYNQERYVKQAIESVLIQRTDFPYELVIGEDCSTDRTREIALEFQQKYANRIRILTPSRNLGENVNFINTLQACKGQYVALLEGDDYWTSSHKLQMQADFLDAHPECWSCFHRALVVFEDKSKKNRLSPSRTRNDIFTLGDILANNMIPTCSVMFRNAKPSVFPSWFSQIKPQDWCLHILNAEHGKIGFMREVMAVYRVHSGGTWSRKSPIHRLQDTIRMLEQVNVHLDYRYDEKIRSTISALYLSVAVDPYWAGKGNQAEARKYAGMASVECLRDGRLSMAILIGIWLVVLFPRLCDLILSAPGLGEVLRETVIKVAERWT